MAVIAAGGILIYGNEIAIAKLFKDWDTAFAEGNYEKCSDLWLPGMDCIITLKDEVKNTEDVSTEDMLIVKYHGRWYLGSWLKEESDDDSGFGIRGYRP